MMNDIINPWSGLLAIKSYSVSKLLCASGKTSLLNFPSKGKLCDPIDRSICNLVMPGKFIANSKESLHQ